MADERIVTAAEMELMTPDERHRLVNERVVTDLSQVDPDFLAGAKAQGRALYEQRKAIDSKQA